MLIVIWIVYFAIYIFGFSRLRIKTHFIRKKDKLKSINYACGEVKRISNYIMKKTKTNVIVKGLENIPDETCVFISNHQGNLDPIPIMANVPGAVSVIAKKELMKFPLVNGWLKDMNASFLDRTNAKEGIKAMNQGIDNVKNGINMLIFPEGTRNFGKEMLEFKKGSLRLATKTLVPIVPITIDGAYKIFEEGKKVRGNTIYITFHEKIETKNLTLEEKNNLLEKVKDVIQSGLKKGIN